MKKIKNQDTYKNEGWKRKAGWETLIELPSHIASALSVCFMYWSLPS